MFSKTTIFHELDVAMREANISVSKLANEMKISISTLSMKLKGNAKISLEDAINIKNILGSPLSIEELFKE